MTPTYTLFFFQFDPKFSQICIHTALGVYRIARFVDRPIDLSQFYMTVRSCLVFFYDSACFYVFHD